MTDLEAQEKVLGRILERLKARTPYDTGNLCNDATKNTPIEFGVGYIKIVEDIAPYFKYVNNYPELTFRRKVREPGGKKTEEWEIIKKANKNYHYVEYAMNDIMDEIAKELGARLVVKR